MSIVFNKKNLGFSNGNNVGASYAKGDFIASRARLMQNKGGDSYINIQNNDHLDMHQIYIEI